MGLTLSDDFAKLKRDLAALGDIDPVGLNKKIGEVLVSSTKKRFEDEKGPDGKAWPKSYRASASGGQTLSDKGRLKNSISYHADANGVEEGTNVKYAHVHQEGMEIKVKNAKYLRFQVGGGWAKKKKVTIPKRPFLGIDDDDMEEIDGTVIDHIKGRSL